jgi:hypothetical protein
MEPSLLTEKREIDELGRLVLQRAVTGYSRVLSRMTRLTFGFGPKNKRRPRESLVTFK